MVQEKSKHKILLISASASDAKKISSWLRDVAEIIHLKDYERDSVLLKRMDWSMVIIEFMSDYQEGFYIIEKLKKKSPFLPMLMIAENVKIDFILTAMSHHVNSIVFQPIKKSELLTRVRNIMDEHHRKKSSRKKIVLAVGAHPDDVEFGCGGTLARMREEGAEINIMTLSLGAVGGNPTIRNNEAKKAADLMQARLFCGELPDTEIRDSVETIQLLEDVMHTVKPTHVYTHSIHDHHQDHRNVYQATVIASRSIPNLYSYLSPSSTILFHPNIFVNIDHYIEDKINCINVYASQLDKKPYLKPDMIWATARYWGRYSNYVLVEPMEVIKEQL